MKKISVVIAMLISSNLFAESDLFGYWLTPSSIVLIENCDKHLCAKIETIFVEEDRDPKLILDENNKNKSLRSRTIVGINVLSGFLIKDPEQREKMAQTYKDALRAGEDATAPGDGGMGAFAKHLVDNGGLDMEMLQKYPKLLKLFQGGEEVVEEHSPEDFYNFIWERLDLRGKIV